jgi:hypothetical protein
MNGLLWMNTYKYSFLYQEKCQSEEFFAMEPSFLHQVTGVRMDERIASFDFNPRGLACFCYSQKNSLAMISPVVTEQMVATRPGSIKEWFKIYLPIRVVPE